MAGTEAPYVTAEVAAQMLGVTRQTLYSYVSRGIVLKAPSARGSTSLFSRSAIAALAAERRRGRRPADTARAALDWGLPVLETEITLIESGRLFYRGRDAIELSGTATVEDVASLLWQQPLGRPTTMVTTSDGPTGELPSDIVARFAAATRTQFAPSWQEDEARVAEGCSALMQTMACAVLDARSLTGSIAETVARHWRLDEEGAGLVRRALVLCADHELNASTFVVRCIASTGADLPAALIGGLEALSGPKHGGATARVGAFLNDVPKASDAEGRIVLALNNGLSVPGFRHPLYPGGDPRAAAILGSIAELDPIAAAVRDSAHSIAGVLPNLDFALVALTRSLGLPPSAAFALFAIGRTTGWIAHALEQRAHPGDIRPRARYTGTRPSDAG